MNKHNKGQSVVEYIMLLAVMVVIGMTIFKSDLFTKFMGSDSEFFAALRGYFEYTYRHGTPTGRNEDMTQTGISHDSYYKNGSTRFFLVKEYP